MLPAALGAVLPLLVVVGSEVVAEDVPLLLELDEGVVLALLALEASTFSLSFTFLTPGTDSAIFLASLRSCLEATLPSSVTTPLFTVTVTFENAGFVESCSWTLVCKV